MTLYSSASKKTSNTKVVESLEHHETRVGSLGEVRLDIVSSPADRCEHALRCLMKLVGIELVIVAVDPLFDFMRQAHPLGRVVAVISDYVAYALPGLTWTAERFRPPECRDRPSFPGVRLHAFRDTPFDHQVERIDLATVESSQRALKPAIDCLRRPSSVERRDQRALALGDDAGVLSWRHSIPRILYGSPPL